MVIVGIASIASAQMTNINVNGSSNTTPAPSVVVIPAGQAHTIPQAIPQAHPYVVVQTTPQAGMTNLNFNGVSMQGVVAPNARLRAIPNIQPRIVIRSAANGRMTNVNINNGGQQTVLEPIPNSGAFVILHPRSGQRPTQVPTIVHTPVPTPIQTPVITRPIAQTPTVTTPQLSPTALIPVVPPSTASTAQPPVIAPQSITVQPVRAIYGEARWFGASLPSRNFEQMGLGIRYGIIDLFAPFIDGRFDFDYYPVGTRSALEFALNAQFLVASSSSPVNRELYFDVFTGLGPRLYISDNSTSLAFGGYVETEMRYGKLAPFLALDATVPIYTFQASTTKLSSTTPILIGVEIGVNFYF